MLYYLQVGGFFMWPIFALMVLATMVILEKLYQLYLMQFSLKDSFKSDLKNAIYSQNLASVKSLCLANKNAISKVILKAMDVKDEEEKDLAYECIMINELKNLERGGFLLGIAISICPQLGLLGTVTGMIASFLGLSKESSEALVAAGISEALYTTAYGLSVAIFALAFHVVFNKRIDYLNNEIYFYLELFKRKFDK